MTPEERRNRLYRTMGEEQVRNPERRRYSAGGSSGSTVRTSREHRYTSSRKRRKRGPDLWQIFMAVLIAALLIVGGIFIVKKIMAKSGNAEGETVTEVVSEIETVTVPETSEPETEAIASVAEEILAKAERLAAQYDYEAALELISNSPEIQNLQEVKDFVTKTQATMENLVEQDVTKVTHVFFHILCVDPENAFYRWGTQSEGYNSLMTTIPEFERILEEMYKKGYVLVSLHDLGQTETQADGSEVMVKGKIMLPEGKQAFIMSEDDVCYYEYMEGAGFADKMIIGEDGLPTLHYTDKDGNESVGDYDIVPILDKFIEEHPDFSYHGHKACLVFTGYNGVLGYRTDETYLPENYEEHKVEGGHDVEAERKEAVEVMKALVEDGYDLGCHSWGHRDMGAMSADAMKTDMDKWEKNVNSLIREATGKGTDILIYPKGADIGDWRGYTSSDQKKEGCREKFNYLYNMGYRYFCNVDSTQYWIQFGSNYIRTGRRALDGYNIYYDMTENKGRFKDLWDDSSYIFDSRRPTPVNPY